MRMRLTYTIFVQCANLARFVFTAITLPYASEESEVGQTPVVFSLIFSTSRALNSSKFSGFATDN